MPKILLDIPDDAQAQIFLQYFVPNLSFVATAELFEDLYQQENDNGQLSVDVTDDNEEDEETDNQVSEPPLYYTPKPSYTVQDIEAIAAQFPGDYQWTYNDLQQYFPQNLKIKVEILANELLIMPSPSQKHQEIVGELYVAMRTFSKKNKLGKVILSPFDMVFDENTVQTPDIFYVSISRQEILDGKRALGDPDLVVEVWSEGNKKREREEKRALYEQKGVTEFWAIYPKKEKITVEVLNEQGKYQVYSEAKKSGEIHSKILEGFSINVEEILAP
jgi:Uma2 family endonuclease